MDFRMKSQLMSDAANKEEKKEERREIISMIYLGEENLKQEPTTDQRQEWPIEEIGLISLTAPPPTKPMPQMPESLIPPNNNEVGANNTNEYAGGSTKNGGIIVSLNHRQEEEKTSSEKTTIEQQLITLMPTNHHRHNYHHPTSQGEKIQEINQGSHTRLKKPSSHPLFMNVWPRSDKRPKGEFEDLLLPNLDETSNSLKELPRESEQTGHHKFLNVLDKVPAKLSCQKIPNCLPTLSTLVRCCCCCCCCCDKKRKPTTINLIRIGERPSFVSVLLCLIIIFIASGCQNIIKREDDNNINNSYSYDKSTSSSYDFDDRASKPLRNSALLIAYAASPSDQDYKNSGYSITRILNSFFERGYDKRVRPNYGGPPVEVNVTMHILSISSVSEVMMDFTADFYFRQTWVDPRLSFKKLAEINTLYVGAEVSKKIWLPDTFFGNEKLAYFHEATTPNVFLRIDHSGEVYRSIRLTVTSSCPMNLQYFPMDRQRCTIEAESYGYNIKDIIYHWAREDTAVERDSKISLPQFDITKTVQKYRLENLISGTYSRLIAEIHFARRMGYYLIQIYIPSSLIVVISWVSFWLHRNASPARVQLGVTTVLTMTTLMSSTNAALPKISYVKSIDIFLGTCFIMVFAALLEYATVGYLGKRIAMRKQQAQHASAQAQARALAQIQAQAAGSQGEPFPEVIPGTPPFMPMPMSIPPMNLAPTPQQKQQQLPGGGIAQIQPMPNQGDSMGVQLPPPTSSTTGTIHRDQQQQQKAQMFTSKATVAAAAAFLNMHHHHQAHHHQHQQQQHHQHHQQHQHQQYHHHHGPPIRTVPNYFAAGIWGLKDKNLDTVFGFTPSSIDKYSRVVFPVCFVCFQLMYWIVYLHISAFLDKEEHLEPKD